MISYLFKEIFYEPLFNGLIFLYGVVPNHDMGISIVILTVAIRLILWPLTGKGIRSQKALAALQPRIEEIKKKFKDNKEAQAKALMALYSENKINPLSGILPILVQIPIIIALWQVFLNSTNLDLNSIYWFIQKPEVIQTSFLGLFDLTNRSVLLALVAGALQYFQTKMIMPTFAKPARQLADGAAEGKLSGGYDFGKIMSKQMLYFGPVISIVIFWRLPAALPLYWIVVTLMTMLQQHLSENNGKNK